MEIKNRNSFMVQGWMVNALHLSDKELLVFAIIWGFSQDGESSYYGGLDYLAQWVGKDGAPCTKHTILEVLKRLTAKGYIIKGERRINNVAFSDYRVAPALVDGDFAPVVQFAEGVQKMHPGGAKNAPGKININKDIDNNISNTRARNFDFREGLISLGVSPEVADAWMLVRENKKGTNTKIALDGVAREIAKTGRRADECIRIAVERSWLGFNASWIENAMRTRITPSQQPQRQSAQMEMLKEAAAFNGRNFNPGQGGPSYDEQ